MAGKIALVGGDEFWRGCEDMDRAILRSTGVGSPALVVLPTAAAFENPARAASNGVGYFSSLGARASALMVGDSSQANAADELSALDDADVIYFTGGNPAHLLGVLSGSVLLSRLRRALDRGAVLAGSSAGAMVLGSWMRFQGRWSEALGIVPGIAVLPHHERSDPDAAARGLRAPSRTLPGLGEGSHRTEFEVGRAFSFLPIDKGETKRGSVGGRGEQRPAMLDASNQAAPSGVTALGIDAMTCCFVEHGRWQVMGKGHVTVYRDGQWRRYSRGESINNSGEL